MTTRNQISEALFLDLTKRFPTFTLPHVEYIEGDGSTDYVCF